MTKATDRSLALTVLYALKALLLVGLLHAMTAPSHALTEELHPDIRVVTITSLADGRALAITRDGKLYLEGDPNLAEATWYVMPVEHQGVASFLIMPAAEEWHLYTFNAAPGVGPVSDRTVTEVHFTMNPREPTMIAPHPQLTGGVNVGLRNAGGSVDFAVFDPENGNAFGWSINGWLDDNVNGTPVSGGPGAGPVGGEDDFAQPNQTAAPTGEGSVTFFNNQAEPLQVAWLDPDGSYQTMGVVPPGGQVPMTGSAGWNFKTFRMDGSPLTQDPVDFVLQDGPGQQFDVALGASAGPADGPPIVTIVIQNTSSLPLDVYFDDAQGGQEFLITVPANMQLEQQSPAGAVWRLAVGDDWVDAVRVTDAARQVVRYPARTN